MDSDSDCPPLLSNDEPEEQPTTSSRPVEFSLWHTFKHHIPHVLLTIVVDLLLPLAVYLILHKRTRPVHALAAAGVPPLIMVIVKGILSRTFDALGFLVFVSFMASAIAAIITHNPLILLFEKSLITALISLIFGVTLLPFHCCTDRCRIRPLAYYFYQDLVPANRAQVGLPDVLFDVEQDLIDDQFMELNGDNSASSLTPKQEVAQVYEWIYRHCPSFRVSCYLITCLWSVGFLLEFLARLTLILIHISLDKIFIYGHLMLSVMTSLLILLTAICIVRERKQTLEAIAKWKKQYLHIQPEHSQLLIDDPHLKDNPI